ncbi:MAG: Nudix family hydrolase [Gammaproteobacteria bacterium]|nr:Nudix family hydrolase [Gammaproteobacteria bacterium]MCF6230046.1 Nudix family hydrolase [Gammaproteobacteria bacterium]
MQNTEPEQSRRKKHIHVAVGVVSNDKGEILIAQRLAHQPQGGCWEFPGGKLELNESVKQALCRELHEELSIEVGQAVPLITIPFEYPEYSVVLDVWRVTAYAGVPYGREGQAVAWVSVDQLDMFTFPEANRAIISAIRLPSRYLITGRPADDPELFMQRLEKSLQRGVTLVQLRTKTLSDEAFLSLAKRVLSRCHHAGAKVLLNGVPSLMAALPEADGIQLSSHHSRGFSERPIAADKLLGVSCHTLGQLQHAVKMGADFALLSPVLKTATHPDAEPLGWRQFAALVAQVPLPVYALGGMDTSLEGKAHRCGGQGIAAISALWGV